MSNNKDSLTLLDLIVLVLSIYLIGALVADTIFVLPKETSLLLDYIDNVICIFFFIEFFIRFYRATDKLKFIRWGWIDLIASIPMIDMLRYGRIIRVIRLLRLLRAFRSTQYIIKFIFKNKPRGTFTTAATIAILLVMFSSIAILQVENTPDSNIKTAEDAIWWAYVTITTVGYGDRYPVTMEGRIIAGVLMTGGVGLFGTFTAYVASWFVDSKNNDNTLHNMEKSNDSV
jgi:voltage-gated potassium channel